MNRSRQRRRLVKLARYDARTARLAGTANIPLRALSRQEDRVFRTSLGQRVARAGGPTLDEYRIATARRVADLLRRELGHLVAYDEDRRLPRDVT